MALMSVRFSRYSLLVLLAAVLLLPPHGDAQPGRPQPARPASPQSDDTIRQAIRKRFAASKIGANGFQVEVKNGIATLRGEASVPQHKGVATRLAKLAGAREVDNQITISEAARQQPRETQRGKPAARTARSGSPAAPAREAATLGQAMGERPEETPGEAHRTEEGPTEPEATAADRPPRFSVKPSAGRGEARSQRRRY